MKIMDFKKIFTTKTGLAVVIVIITVLSILGYSIVCKRGGSYMFKDSRGEVKENVVTKEVIDVEDSIVVYDYYKENSDGKATDKYFKCICFIFFRCIFCRHQTIMI